MRRTASSKSARKVLFDNSIDSHANVSVSFLYMSTSIGNRRNAESMESRYATLTMFLSNIGYHQN